MGIPHSERTDGFFNGVGYIRYYWGSAAGAGSGETISRADIRSRCVGSYSEETADRVVIAAWVRWLGLQSLRNESANSGGTCRALRASCAPNARPFAAEHAHRFAAAYWSEESHRRPIRRRGCGTAPEVPALARK